VAQRLDERAVRRDRALLARALQDDRARSLRREAELPRKAGLPDPGLAGDEREPRPAAVARRREQRAR
jgi:hypothetical protein